MQKFRVKNPRRIRLNEGESFVVDRRGVVYDRQVFYGTKLIAVEFTPSGTPFAQPDGEYLMTSDEFVAAGGDK